MLQAELVLPTLLRAQAAAAADRVFLQHVDGSSMTYRELDDRVVRWATGLRALHVDPGDTVVVMLPNSFDSAALWAAVARRGAIEVPLNTAYRGVILAHTVNTAGARVGVVHASFLERFESVRDDLDTLETLVVVGEAPSDPGWTGHRLSATDATRQTDQDAADTLPLPHDTSCILYTSGTTGPSKGVIVPWAQAHASATGCLPIEDLGADDAWYSPYPMFHMSGKLALYAAALFGGRFVLREHFQTDSFWDEVRRFGCTVSMLIGSTPAFVWNRPPDPSDRDHPLRGVLMAPMPDDPQSFEDRFGFRIATVFNMTEISCPIRTGYDLGPKGSAGRLRPGYQVRIVDEQDYEVAPGEIGEIVVRSDQPWCLMAGYWRNPEATAAVWRNQWFHTGDAGTYDADGYFYFLDRLKDAIRVRGENVSSMELEAVINDAPHVAEAAAIGVPSEYGEEDIKVYVVPVGDDFDPTALLQYLIPRLPRFMMPRYVTTVAELPKTPTEKVRKGELRDRAPEADMWDRVAAGFEIPRG